MTEGIDEISQLAISGDPRFPLEDMSDPVKGGRIARRYFIGKLGTISTIEFPEGINETTIYRAEEVFFNRELCVGMG